MLDIEFIAYTFKIRKTFFTQNSINDSIKDLMLSRVIKQNWKWNIISCNFCHEIIVENNKRECEMLIYCILIRKVEIWSFIN